MTVDPKPARKKEGGSIKHTWAFKPRFRRHAFGWKSQPAIKRIKEAVGEIRKECKRDPILAAEGAVVFLERVSPAIEQVDGSSGAMGSAVNQAIAELSAIIGAAPADNKTRQAWLNRLWKAFEEDEIPYIETLGEFWGELCASKEIASSWADKLIDSVKLAWSADRKSFAFFKGTEACLSSLFKAERYEELLRLLESEKHRSLYYRKWGALSLASLDQIDEAISYLESCAGLNTSSYSIACLCEEVLLSAGRLDEAYDNYALEANRRTTYLNTYRAVKKKYPHKKPQEILSDLIATTPGEEGKWFATAKDAGFLELASDLAMRSPCDPRTLTRAAADFEKSNPEFALSCALAALHWLGQGYGYEVTTADVWSALTKAIKAAGVMEREAEVRQFLKTMADGLPHNNFVRTVIEKH